MSKESGAPLPSDSQFIVYRTEDGKLKIDVRFEGETVWLTQQHMAALFQTSVPNISMHIRNVFAEGELAAESVVKESLTTAADGKNYATKSYNLDVINKLDGFLTLNERDILTHAGRISHEMAQAKAELEYDKFKALAATELRPVDADFDQATKELKKLPKPKKPKPPKPGLVRT